MRFITFLLIILMNSSTLYAQRVGDNPQVTSQNDNDAKIMTVEINKDETIIAIDVNKAKKESFSINSATTLTTKAGNRFSIKKYTDGRGWLKFGTKYRPNKKRYTLYLYFDKIPATTPMIDIEENCEGGRYWKGITLALPSTKKNTPYSTSNRSYNTFSEAKVKQQIQDYNDGITGIYEGIGNNGYKLACTKDGENYKLIYISAKTNYYSAWHPGDTKAILRTSATYGVFKATWYMANKSANNDALAVFDGVSMKTYVSGEEDYYLKMYPTVSQNGSISPASPTERLWSGTGFALNEGYIATNYHVVDGAKSIKVLGINGTYNNEYNATVIATDKNNDLAIIRINDSRFNGFGTIPYRVKTNTSDVGEDIFVLGYPLTTTMGDEIKLTTGVISSKTGFQGDVSLYQISAPIQPGNSGGPLFDGNGNLIGIVNAKHQGAENVGYAIKASYLRNLMESATSQNILPSNNTISGQALTGKVKILKNYVFMIKCSNKESSGNTYRSPHNYSNSKWEYRTTSDNRECKIIKVETNSDETKVYFECEFEGIYGEWCSISRDTYIEANGTTLKMKTAQGISYSPDYTYYNGNRTIWFTLTFPALPRNSTKFNLIEPGSSSWKFYDVKAKQ